MKKLLALIGFLFISFQIISKQIFAQNEESKTKAKQECVDAVNDNKELSDSLKREMNIEDICSCMVDRIYETYTEKQLKRIEKKGISKMFVVKLISKIQPCIQKELNDQSDQ